MRAKELRLKVMIFKGYVWDNCNVAYQAVNTALVQRENYRVMIERSTVQILLRSLRKS